MAAILDGIFSRLTVVSSAVRVQITVVIAKPRPPSGFGADYFEALT